jgi:hypothetical protein
MSTNSDSFASLLRNSRVRLQRPTVGLPISTAPGIRLTVTRRSLAFFLVKWVTPEKNYGAAASDVLLTLEI